MNSSDKTLQSLVLLPIVAALVGTILMLGISLLPKPAGTDIAVQSVNQQRGTVPENQEITRSGDGIHSFHVARPEGEFESHTL